MERKCIFLSEMMSDDRLGGGRVSAIDGRAIMNFQQTDTDMHLDAWKRSYEGIYKTNFLFENIDKVTYSTEENRKKILGQAYFLRALFYFDLARLFGANVPKILTTDVDKSTPQAKPDEIYSLIMSDLVEAIEILPSVKFEKSQFLIMVWLQSGLQRLIWQEFFILYWIL